MMYLHALVNASRRCLLDVSLGVQLAKRLPKVGVADQLQNGDLRVQKTRSRSSPSENPQKPQKVLEGGLLSLMSQQMRKIETTGTYMDMKFGSPDNFRTLVEDLFKPFKPDFQSGRSFSANEAPSNQG